MQYFSVALLSKEFVSKERTPFLVAPLLSFMIRDKSSFHELTEQSDAMFAVISRHTGLTKFDTMQKVFNYALNDFGLHGTHIYITDLKCQEMMVQGNDICAVQSTSNTRSPAEMVLRAKTLVENSLTSFAKLMYLHQPSFLHLTVNRQRVKLENPFNKLMRAQLTPGPNGHPN